MGLSVLLVILVGSVKVVVAALLLTLPAFGPHCTPTVAVFGGETGCGFSPGTGISVCVATSTVWVHASRVFGRALAMTLKGTAGRSPCSDRYFFFASP